MHKLKAAVKNAGGPSTTEVSLQWGVFGTEILLLVRKLASWLDVQDSKWVLFSFLFLFIYFIYSQLQFEAD